MKTTVAVLAAIGVHGSLSAEQRQDLANAVLQAAPGATAAGLTRFAGLPLADWLILLSMSFIALQAGYLIWKWRRDARLDAERQADRQSAEARGVRVPLSKIYDADEDA